MGYVYLKDDIKAININFSRYSINSLRHHLTFNYIGQISKALTTSVSFKRAQRPTMDAYQVLDASVQWRKNIWTVVFMANNIFNERYTETNLVPMPLGNGLLGASRFLNRLKR